jgi:3-hydroxyisobutyrate dehydrogenase-like beta-hydroxyacid dehydrogenase
MGKTVAYFGDSGAGQAAKATNQIMCAGIIQAVGEAMAFAHAEGLPLDKLIEPWARAPARAGTSSIARPSWPTTISPRVFACACTTRI